MIEALDIQVKGIVQGVGFRPFVYRMAKKYLVNGWVLNAVDGVFIHAEAETKLLDEFVLELSENPPAASRVEEIILKEVPLEDFNTFEIRFSDANNVEKTTLVSPDLAACDDCVRELFDPNDRRYRYPFINCTNCGPRFTIIETLPYDRKNTSMKAFPMCERCAAEYSDPLNRRFHAQPDACFDCGPHISWRERRTGGNSTDQPGEQLASHESASDVGASSVAAGNVSRETSKAASDAAGNMSETASDAAGETSETASDASCKEPGTISLTEVVWGTTREQSDAIFKRAVRLLMEGGIIAVKGLGGFHLVCDARNPKAVMRLRARKQREGKAFAVMMKDAEAAKTVCNVSDVEADLLATSQRPIVLLRKREGATFATGLADKLPELGVMLPYTPVQHLLLHDFEQARRAAGESAPGMLVMTSGNIHDEPIVIDDEDAYAKLANVADAFLGHNRAIRARYDDSVVRVVQAGSAGEALQFIRRARGYAPLPLTLPSLDSTLASSSDNSAPASSAGERVSRETNNSAQATRPLSLFATGPEQKNTFALTRDAEVFVSQHIGDMENAETYDAWLQAKATYERLFEAEPTCVVRDMHPEYLTSKWACDQALPTVSVQHHQAHVASVTGEHGLTGPVCGIAFDGTGYGVDGAIWGGEVLLANLQAFERFANFVYVPMPGGAAAVHHPLRMAYGVLWAYDLLNHPAAAEALEALGDQANVCDQMIERGINTPMTSSVGRLFDAASALLGICTKPTYEGEPAILLEAALGPDFSNAGTSPEMPTGEKSADPVSPVAAAKENVSRETSQAGEQEAARYAIAITKNTATAKSTAQDTSVLLLDAEPTFRALLDDKQAGVPLPTIVRRFHDAFVQAIVASAELMHQIYDINTVALSGGVFMNRYLIENTLAALEQRGFTAAVNRDLPPNDGCVSFGQAVVAWAEQDETSDDAPGAQPES